MPVKIQAVLGVLYRLVLTTYKEKFIFILWMKKVRFMNSQYLA